MLTLMHTWRPAPLNAGCRRRAKQSRLAAGCACSIADRRDLDKNAISGTNLPKISAFNVRCAYVDPLHCLAPANKCSILANHVTAILEYPLQPWFVLNPLLQNACNAIEPYRRRNQMWEKWANIGTRKIGDTAFRNRMLAVIDDSCRETNAPLDGSRESYLHLNNI